MVELSKTQSNILNAVLFQVGWFGCILGGTIIAVWLVPLLFAIHQRLSKPLAVEWVFVAIMTMAGWLIDSTLLNLGLINFGEEYLVIPIWLVGLWALFSSTLFHCLSWLSGKYVLAAIFGGIGGTASYYAGTKLGALNITNVGLVTIAIIWGTLLPLMYWFKSRLIDQFEFARS